MKTLSFEATLKAARIGIAGCGGLGSNCAVALARVGIGTLVVADFDTVTEGNLNRQYYFLDQVGLKKCFTLRDNIRRINPSVKVVTHDIRLDSTNLGTVFSGCDVIVEAFDRADQKLMLIETLAEVMPEVPLVTGIGMAGWGRSQEIRLRQAGNLYICGDERSEIGPEMPPLGPRVGMVANMQANTVLEILLGPDPLGLSENHG